MHEPFLESLKQRLAHAEAQSLRRALRVRATSPEGRVLPHADGPLLNLAGNDYLGLSTHAHLRDAVQSAAADLGVGAGASRLVTGHQPIHAEAETRFAAFKHPDAPGERAALLLATGYTANLAVLTGLAGTGDVIYLDKLNHASLIDAAQASGAKVRTYPHLDAAALERKLQRDHTADSDGQHQRFIVTDSVFSMDGDCADLPRLCDLAEQYGAVLIVDEAHGTGVLGQRGAGLCEAQGVTNRVDIVVSTASKGLGSLGGIVTAPPVVIEALVNFARPLIYSTAVPPTQAASLLAALDVVTSEEGATLRKRLRGLCEHVRGELAARGWQIPETTEPTPIIPLIVGSAEAAIAKAKAMEASGVLAVAIRPPTVPRGAARVRLSLRADLTDADVAQVLDAAGAPEA